MSPVGYKYGMATEIDPVERMKAKIAALEKSEADLLTELALVRRDLTNFREFIAPPPTKRPRSSDVALGRRADAVWEILNKTKVLKLAAIVVEMRLIPEHANVTKKQVSDTLIGNKMRFEVDKKDGIERKGYWRTTEVPF